MTPPEARSMLAKIKENQDRLFSCKRHEFGDVPMPFEMGMTFRCVRCQGDMKAIDAFRYIQGYEAAGRNPNDILNGYRADWKGETFEEAWKAFEAQGFMYGRDALEQVRFGWNIAKGLRTAS